MERPFSLSVDEIFLSPSLSVILEGGPDLDSISCTSSNDWVCLTAEGENRRIEYVQYCGGKATLTRTSDAFLSKEMLTYVPGRGVTRMRGSSLKDAPLTTESMPSFAVLESIACFSAIAVELATVTRPSRDILVRPMVNMVGILLG